MNLRQTRPSTRRGQGFTLVEMLIAMSISSLILAAVCDIMVYGTQQWNKQASQSISTSSANEALDAMEREIRNAMSFTKNATAGLSMYTFTFPANKSGATYIPRRDSDGSFYYAQGGQVAFYVSNLTGIQGLTGGGLSSLWRASRSSSLLGWTLDTGWSRDSTSLCRFPGVTSFDIAKDANNPAVVTISMTMQVVQGSTTRSVTLTRTVVMKNATS